VKTLASGCGGKQETFSSDSYNMKMLFDTGERIYVSSITGLPEGTKISYGYTGAGGVLSKWPFLAKDVPYFQQGRGTMTLMADIPADAPPGKYTVAITTAAASDGSGPASTFELPMEVIDFSVMHTPPASAPRIPRIEDWEATMVENGAPGKGGGGAFWCNKSTGSPNPEPLAFGVESQIWYYDGARVYSRIADYTGDPSWNRCRNAIAEQYKGYLVSNNSAVPGYRVFPHGLGLMHESGAPGYDDVLKNFSKEKGTLWVLYGGRVHDRVIRETAYAGDVYYALEHYLKTGPAPQRDTNADLTISHLMAWCSGGPYNMRLWFQAALAAESLIQYHSLTGDKRVPWVIGCLTRAMTANYSKSTHVLPYAADPEGPYCNNAQTWYALLIIGNCNSENYETSRVLNLLIAPVYAWYWQYTSDAEALEMGDELWRYGVETGIPWSGKNFSQQYRWSFDYVAWRTRTATSPSAMPQSSKNSRWARVIH
jgi:hypothetical protein